MPDLVAPRTVVPVVTIREGGGFGIRPHGRTDIDVVAGTARRVRVVVLDEDGRRIPVAGRTGIFRIDDGVDVLFELAARPDPTVRGVFLVDLTVPVTMALKPGEYAWAFDIMDPEVGPERLRHAGPRVTTGVLRVHPDPVLFARPAFEFTSFVGENVDYDPSVVRWYTSSVAGPATVGLPVGIFTVQFVFQGFTGSVGIDVLLDSVADASSERWTTIGPRFDGEPHTLTAFDGTDAWTVEADVRWIRAWWQPDVTVPSSGSVSKILVMV